MTKFPAFTLRFTSHFFSFLLGFCQTVKTTKTKQGTMMQILVLGFPSYLPAYFRFRWLSAQISITPKINSRVQANRPTGGWPTAQAGTNDIGGGVGGKSKIWRISDRFGVNLCKSTSCIRIGKKIPWFGIESNNKKQSPPEGIKGGRDLGPSTRTVCFWRYSAACAGSSVPLTEHVSRPHLLRNKKKNLVLKIIIVMYLFYGLFCGT